MAAPGFVFGVNNRHPASVGSGTNSLGVVLYEEQATGSNGFGQRMAVRHYENYPKDVFTSGSDHKTKFDGGRLVVVSVSGGYSMTSVSGGTHDAEWNACFDRMFALGFGGTDTSGAGTKKPLIAPLCFYHEVDVPGHNVDAAQFVAAFKHIRTLRNARATAAGVAASHVPMMTIFTAYGVNIGRAKPYWPGDDQVDLFGVDGYSGLGGGPWTEPASIFGGSLTFAAAHGNKNILICETSVKAETGHDVGAWWSNFTALVNSKPQIIGVLAFQGAPGDQTVNFDKVGWPAKHAGMQAFIASTGATAGYGASGGNTQLPPSSPTGVSFVSDFDGTAGTLTWDANPTGDNIQFWDVFKAPGLVTSGFVKLNATQLPASPRSYRVTGLTPGAGYSFTVVAINSAGRSGFGSIAQGIATNPGPTNLSPAITAIAATIDGADPTLVHLTSSAIDPNGDALTYSWTIAGPKGFADSQTGANADANYDPGAYVATLSVSDGTLTTTQTVSFSIDASQLFTDDSHYQLPQPGDDLRDVTRIYRQTVPDIDAKLTAARKNRNTHNTIHGFVASTFDPVLASTTKSSYVAGDFRWYPMKLEDDTITGIATYVSDVQSGNGVSFCIHAIDGSQLCNVQTGSVVDAAVQSTGDTEFDLDQPITNVTAGQIVTLGVWFPSGTTPFKTYLSAASNVMGSVRLTQGFWRGNGVASQTAYPDVLPFSSATVYIPAFFALY